MSKELTELKNIADSFFAKADAFVKTIKAQDPIDPHAASKALYAEDAKTLEKPWELWEYQYTPEGAWYPHASQPIWNKYCKYRRKPKPKKQLIDWSHPFFKGCATNYGEFVSNTEQNLVYILTPSGFVDGFCLSENDIRLAAPANEDANWQYFRSTPENDAKLRELAKMVKVQVRYWCGFTEQYAKRELKATDNRYIFISNYRITGECQEGWTDNPKEAQS